MATLLAVVSTLSLIVISCLCGKIAELKLLKDEYWGHWASWQKACLAARDENTHLRKEIADLKSKASHWGPNSKPLPLTSRMFEHEQRTQSR